MKESSFVGLVLIVGKVSERVAVDAVIHLRCFLQVHSAHAAAKRTAFIKLEARLVPDPKIFGDGVTVVFDNLKRVRILRDEARYTGPLEIF